MPRLYLHYKVQGSLHKTSFSFLSREMGDDSVAVRVQPLFCATNGRRIHALAGVTTSCLGSQTAIKLRGLVLDITHFPDAEFHSERRDSNFVRHFWGKMNNFFRGSRTREAKEYKKPRGGRDNPS